MSSSAEQRPRRNGVGVAFERVMNRPSPFISSLLFLSAAWQAPLFVAAGCTSEEGPRLGENGCPAHVDDIPDVPCEAEAVCEYYKGFCATDWSCDHRGEWLSLLTCVSPSDGNWCREPAVIGKPCWPIEVVCPQVEPGNDCTLPTPMAVCGPDYLWEPSGEQPPTCKN
jgi:hypothetical protein